MREATGSALLIGMVSSIIAVIMIFFVGSISYSKSYKIKNHIIDLIEQNNGWTNNLEDEINTYLGEVGYNVNEEGSCPSINKCNLVHDNKGFNYCVYDCSDNSEKLYKVKTFMRFEFPVIGAHVYFEVNGETKTFGKFN